MDLIKNLRTKPPTYEDAVAAADEIERLREALRKIDLATSVYALKNIPEVVSQLARSALQQKESE